VKEAKIAELKNRLSRYLALVRKGEVIRILDRDVPIAQIVPLGLGAAGGGRGEDVLIALERKGLVRRGEGRIPREILSHDPPGDPVGAVAALIEERRAR
jgi:antitoxin (DNA-binding transcriptional repressor) of toxin-antitoxin stability system